jgi:hypothetical protein
MSRACAGRFPKLCTEYPSKEIAPGVRVVSQLERAARWLVRLSSLVPLAPRSWPHTNSGGFWRNRCGFGSPRLARPGGEHHTRHHPLADLVVFADRQSSPWPTTVMPPTEAAAYGT